MSEDSKMGLFGSKDKNQEQREKSSKDNSPARYAPYCIDSDTETYDTEALSMMDINDIIGVQSGEQTSDSTLESEIAALSQIITESKVDSTQQPIDSKLETQQESSKVSTSSADTTCPTNSANISNICTANQPEIHVASSICEQTNKETTVLMHESAMSEESLSVTTEKSISKIMKPVSVKCKAADMDTEKTVDNRLSSNDKSCTEIKLSTGILVDTVKDIKKKEEEAIDKSMKQDEMLEYKSETKSVVTVGSISKSLQLIGEAYISEDSEETNMNDSDSPKEASSLSFSQETSFGISTIQRNEENTENVEKSFKLSDADNMTITKESNVKVEDVVDREIKHLNKEVEEPGDSSQNETLQKNLDDLNKTVCDNAISNTCKQMETNPETDDVDKFERVPAEYSLSNEILMEVEDTSAISATSLMQTAKPEESSKSELNTIDPKASVSAFTSETEKQDNVMVFVKNKVPNTKKINDNCVLIDDNTKEVLMEDVSKYKNKNIPSESENQNSILNETSNEKSNTIEAVYKSDLSQEASTTGDSSQITHKIVSTADKINDDSQETDVAQTDLETAAVTCGNQNNVNLAIYAEKTSTPSDERASGVISSAANKKLNLDEDTMLQTPVIEEKESDDTGNTLSVSSNVLDERRFTSNLHLIDSLTQSNASITLADYNNFKPMIIGEGDISIKVPESLHSNENNESSVQLSPEKSEVDEINKVVSNKSEEQLVSADKTHDNVENLTESLCAIEKTGNLEMKTEKAVSLPTTECKSPTKEMQHTLDQSELYTQAETTDFTVMQIKDKRTLLESVSSSNIILSDTNLVTDNSMIINDDGVSPLHSTIEKENNIKENITAESTKEEIIAESKNYANKEVGTLKVSPAFEIETLESNVEMANTEDENSQKEMHDETVKEFKKLLKESTDVNMELMSEENVESNESPTDTIKKDTQSSAISVSTLQKDSEETTEEQNKDVDLKDDCEDSKNILNVSSTAETLSEIQSSKDAIDAVTMMLNDNVAVADVKNILEPEGNMEEIETDSLQSTADLRLEANIEKLAKKLSQDSVHIDDTIAAHNMDSLRGLLDLDLMSGNENPSLKNAKLEDKVSVEELVSKNVDMGLLLDQTNQGDATMTQNPDYITNVISSLTNTVEEPIVEESINDGIPKNKANELKANEDGNTEQTTDEKIVEPPRTDNNSQRNDLDAVFEDNQLESVGDLEEVESKLELPQDILEGVVSRENLTDIPSVIENSQSSSEISELESAVKFLQESEEQTIDSPLVLSPKMVESVVEDITKQADTELYAVPDETDNFTNTESELASHISISISEAEIISEAAKLENERKYAVQMQNVTDTKATVKNSAEEVLQPSGEVKQNEETEDHTCSKPSSDFVPIASGSLSVQTTEEMSKMKETIPDIKSLSREGILKTCELLPRTSILEERLKEPPKIEIPVPDSTKMLETSVSPNDNLLIPKDSRAMIYPRMLESPKSNDKTNITESAKNVDTSRKDSEKYEFENVGSPRIILKIAKSAITDCAEPRSPKSPKIRSAANSPNPEDSPGQKLGKIKLKLSKGGHPSIISNENLEETSQWHTDNTSSLSPIGMKIKLSKSGDASIVGTAAEKYENNSEDSKEATKYKIEEPKRTDSPIGVKIKLSKSGDSASIVQDKEIHIKHKEKLEIPQGSPKRTESPIGMKIKLSKTGDASIIQSDWQESTEEHKEITPKRTDSPIGMKIKLSKTGDASIVTPSDSVAEDTKDSLSKAKEKQDYAIDLPKRTESPIGMKIKLSKGKGGAASIISVDNIEDTKEKLGVPELSKRTESPLGMKIKLSKSGDASIIHSEVTDDKETRHREKSESTAQDTAKPAESSGIKIKVLKTGDTSMSKLLPDANEEQDIFQASETSPIGMKIKVSKSGDASVAIGTSSHSKTEQAEDSKLREAQAEAPKRTESPIGMKIKLSKSGDASIVQTETTTVLPITEDHQNKVVRPPEIEHVKSDLPSSSSLGMKIKLFKTGDASVVETEGSRKDKQQKRNKDIVESPLEIKIKLSKTGHPTIVACDSHDNQGSSTHKIGKESPSTTPDSALASFSHRYAEHHTAHIAHSKESPLKLLKATGGTASHPSILQSNRSELTIEPVTPIQIQNRKAMESALEISAKRKDITISSLDSKKLKLEAQLSQILPEVTIQPVVCRDQQKQQQQQQQLLFDPKTSLISRQQMNVISQEISITQVRPTKTSQDMSSMSDKLKDILSKKTTSSPGGSDCEIIEHRPELIIVNENSNSSQDVVIIEEVTPNRMADIKVPKKRGRPRRNPLTQQHIQQPPQMLMSRDSLSLEEVQQVPQFEPRENERPKRTCRNQKSYAPPKRGRGRGRGKRKLDNSDIPIVGKKARIDQDLSAIETSTMAVITIDETPSQQDPLRKSSELYKALKQPPMDLKGIGSTGKMDKHSPLMNRKEIGKKDSKASEASAIAMQLDSTRSSCGVMQDDMLRPSTSQTGSTTLLDSKDGDHKRSALEVVSEKVQKGTIKQYENKNKASLDGSRVSEVKEVPIPPGHSNWLTPISKKQADANIRGGEAVSTVQVIDEETRMSAESCSRSQTPARNIPAPASETTINEESQGSVLSTATTESEKVKVKNRRMEINFDPDEGPFTVDKIAEYEWPLDRKGETFMIQEQISQYLGVKSFKRKYPDLKRRMVDMEERNYLRENGLVSEAMCDMGLTAVSSSEVLDVMCSDFPDQYEEYRKHMREKQVKEHSKKQKELTAAANAERNRIDLAEMAVQSALSWNISLNKARKENRKCCLDLQTFTIHVPKKQQKIDTDYKASHYPVALIPGQYTDYYREYTSAELRYYPLNTVLYGPTRPNERKFDSQSEASQSDSDSESSSDDSSSSSSEGTQDTEGSQSTMDDVDMEIVTQKDDVKLKCKMCLKVLNKHNKTEILIQCGTCNGNVHPSCIDLTLDMVPHIQSYAWQCTDCKTCAQCHDPADEDKMLFCDMCDRGYHIYCVGLRRVPQGRWHCQECAVCANCGSREPGGANSDRNSVAQWQHEYKKGEKNTRVYISTLCVQCSKLWRKGRYCPHCSRCHTAQRLDLEANLVHCSACDKYLHLDCVETKGVVVDKKNYLCDFCTPSNRQQVMKPLMSKMLKT